MESPDTTTSVSNQQVEENIEMVDAQSDAGQGPEENFKEGQHQMQQASESSNDDDDEGAEEEEEEVDESGSGDQAEAPAKPVAAADSPNSVPDSSAVVSSPESPVESGTDAAEVEVVEAEVVEAEAEAVEEELPANYPYNPLLEEDFSNDQKNQILKPFEFNLNKFDCTFQALLTTANGAASMTPLPGDSFERLVSTMRTNYGVIKGRYIMEVKVLDKMTDRLQVKLGVSCLGEGLGFMGKHSFAFSSDGDVYALGERHKRAQSMRGMINANSNQQQPQQQQIDPNNPDGNANSTANLIPLTWPRSDVFGILIDIPNKEIRLCRNGGVDDWHNDMIVEGRPSTPGGWLREEPICRLPDEMYENILSEEAIEAGAKQCEKGELRLKPEYALFPTIESKYCTVQMNLSRKLWKPLPIKVRSLGQAKKGDLLPTSILQPHPKTLEDKKLDTINVYVPITFNPKNLTDQWIKDHTPKDKVTGQQLGAESMVLTPEVLESWAERSELKYQIRGANQATGNPGVRHFGIVPMDNPLGIYPILFRPNKEYFLSHWRRDNSMKGKDRTNIIARCRHAMNAKIHALIDVDNLKETLSLEEGSSGGGREIRDLYEVLSLPGESEGFDTITYKSSDSSKSQEELKLFAESLFTQWKKDCKLKSRVSDLKKGITYPTLQKKFATYKQASHEKTYIKCHQQLTKERENRKIKREEKKQELMELAKKNGVEEAAKKKKAVEEAAKAAAAAAAKSSKDTGAPDDDVTMKDAVESEEDLVKETEEEVGKEGTAKEADDIKDTVDPEPIITPEIQKQLDQLKKEEEEDSQPLPAVNKDWSEEDWALAQLRFEILATLYAFRNDVGTHDIERKLQGFASTHFAFYFGFYTGKNLERELAKFGCKNLDELTKLVPEVFKHTAGFSDSELRRISRKGLGSLKDNNNTTTGTVTSATGNTTASKEGVICSETSTTAKPQTSLISDFSLIEIADNLLTGQPKLIGNPETDDAESCTVELPQLKDFPKQLITATEKARKIRMNRLLAGDEHAVLGFNVHTMHHQINQNQNNQSQGQGINQGNNMGNQQNNNMNQGQANGQVQGGPGATNYAAVNGNNVNNNQQYHQPSGQYGASTGTVYHRPRGGGGPYNRRA